MQREQSCCLPLRPGKLGSQEVEIAITHCGVCHSDLHLISNDWGISQFPFIPGHEVIGTVAALGNEVRALEVGQRVGLGWQSNSCGVCDWCLRGLENLCPNAEGTCVHRHGGYADRVRANARFVVPIPEALPANRPLRCYAAASPSIAHAHPWHQPLLARRRRGYRRPGTHGRAVARVFGAQVTAFSTSAAKERKRAPWARTNSSTAANPKP